MLLEHSLIRLYRIMPDDTEFTAKPKTQTQVKNKVGEGREARGVRRGKGPREGGREGGMDESRE